MVSVKRADFDIVHDVQQIYKKMLYALSYPGKIYNLSDIEEKLNLSFEYNRSLVLIAMCVLDREVSLCVMGDNPSNEQAGNYLKNITYTQLNSDSICDYLIVSGKYTADEIAKEISCGTLIDPHKSTTVIIEVEELNDEKVYELQGAGIKDINYINPVGLDGEFIDKRNEMCSQFPMGFDIFLCDKSGNILGIPRTTKIRRCV